jgi:FAD synthetase
MATYSLDKAKMEDVLTTILASSNLRCIFLGERATDSRKAYAYGHAVDESKTFAMTTGKYPKMCRIHPIIDWNYGNVWQFILQYKCLYCPMYDRGYTSIGTVDNTIPNPALYVEAKGEYLPAHMLADPRKERDSRLAKPKATTL